MIVKSWSWWLAVLVVVSPSLARATTAGCGDIYPDAQVAQRLAKAEYAACTLESMAVDYAKVLEEQARLLQLLRPAYERRIKKDFDKQAGLIRLGEFDARLDETSALANATLVPQPDLPKGGAAKAPAANHPVQNLLNKGKQQSDALRSRIALSKDGLEGGEPDIYCKLDFFFRLGDGLHSRMRSCLQ
jgi:hypothetical protein